MNKEGAPFLVACLRAELGRQAGAGRRRLVQERRHSFPLVVSIHHARVWRPESGRRANGGAISGSGPDRRAPGRLHLISIRANLAGGQYTWRTLVPGRHRSNGDDANDDCRSQNRRRVPFRWIQLPAGLRLSRQRVGTLATQAICIASRWPALSNHQALGSVPSRVTGPPAARRRAPGAGRGLNENLCIICRGKARVPVGSASGRPLACGRRSGRALNQVVSIYVKVEGEITRATQLTRPPGPLAAAHRGPLAWPRLFSGPLRWPAAAAALSGRSLARREGHFCLLGRLAPGNPRSLVAGEELEICRRHSTGADLARPSRRRARATGRRARADHRPARAALRPGLAGRKLARAVRLCAHPSQTAKVGRPAGQGEQWESGGSLAGLVFVCRARSRGAQMPTDMRALHFAKTLCLTCRAGSPARNPSGRLSSGRKGSFKLAET